MYRRYGIVDVIKSLKKTSGLNLIVLESYSISQWGVVIAVPGMQGCPML